MERHFQDNKSVPSYRIEDVKKIYVAPKLTKLRDPSIDGGPSAILFEDSTGGTGLANS